MSMTKREIFELFSAGCRHSYNSHNKTNSLFVTCFLPHLMEQKYDNRRDTPTRS